MSDTWCPLPWNFSAIRSNGDVRVCCHANASPNKGTLVKDDGSPFNAKFDSISESRNSKRLQVIRSKMLDGIWAEECKRCREEEESGIRSRRMYEIDNWGFAVGKKNCAQLTKKDGSINLSDFPIKSIDLRLGNKCNLRCRMCGPQDSSSWYEDYYYLEGQSFKDTHGTVNLIKDANGKVKIHHDCYSWYDNPRFWNELSEDLFDVEHIHIVGGEPFLIKEHFDFLKRLIENGWSKNIRLEYNSNGTVVPSEALESWRHFKSVHVGISFDGIQKMNDYIRHPSKWHLIEKNLTKLDAYDGPIKLWLSLTVQAYNIFYLPEIHRWKIRSGFDKINVHNRNPLINSHTLHRPLSQNIRMFPLPIKKVIESKLIESFSMVEQELKNSPNHANLADKHLEIYKKSIKGYINYMNQEDWSNQFREFVYHTITLDRLRSESFSDTFPDFYRHLEPYFEKEREHLDQIEK